MVHVHADGGAPCGASGGRLPGEPLQQVVGWLLAHASFIVALGRPCLWSDCLLAHASFLAHASIMVARGRPCHLLSRAPCRVAVLEFLLGRSGVFADEQAEVRREGSRLVSTLGLQRCAHAHWMPGRTICHRPCTALAVGARLSGSSMSAPHERCKVSSWLGRSCLPTVHATRTRSAQHAAASLGGPPSQGAACVLSMRNPGP